MTADDAIGHEPRAHQGSNDRRPPRTGSFPSVTPRRRPGVPRVVSRLETLIRSAPDEAVFRINPIRFAAERGVSENEAVDLFLHATLGPPRGHGLAALLPGVFGHRCELS